MSANGQVTTIAILGLLLAAPIIWAALGELVSEQGGMINPGVEGLMIFGALAAILGYHHTQSLLLATGCAVGVGLGAGVLLAYLYITRGLNQIITGILFNLFALGATTVIFVNEEYLTRTRVEVPPKIDIPALSEIPFVGPVFFEQDIFVYAAYVTVFAVFYLMRKTGLGLEIRAAGEHPQAVEAAGVNVWNVRYVATIVGAILPAVGGAVLVLAIVGGFNAGLTAGQGFIALGVVVLARWNPFAAFAAALLFGIAQSLQFEAQNIAALEGVPTEFLLAFPYVVTVLAVMFARGSEYPAAAAVPYPRPAERGWIRRRVVLPIRHALDARRTRRRARGYVQTESPGSTPE